MISKLSVSSSLNRKEFNKQCMIDGSDETCWQSDQGSPQFVVVDFINDIKIQNISIMFQGGFAGIETKLYFYESDSPVLIDTYYLNDDNSSQQIQAAITTRKLKLEFKNIMSLKFTWPAFTLEQINLAKEHLTFALNSGPKTPNIVGDIVITDLNLGTKAPELTCVSLDDLQASSKFPRSKVMLHLVYDGDAHLVLQTLVQVNPLTRSKNDIRPWDYMVAANQPLIVPLNIKIAQIRLKGIISLAFDVDQGVTIKFKSENPLTSLLVSSSFDHVESIKKVLQDQIENQVRSLFKTDLPLIIYRLSQTFVKERSRESSPIKSSPIKLQGRSQDSVSSSSREFNSQEIDGKDLKSHKEKWGGNSDGEIFLTDTDPIRKINQSEEGLGNLEADSNVNLIVREKLKHSSRSYPSSRASTSLTDTTSSSTKSGFRKIKSFKGPSSVTGSRQINSDGISRSVEKEDGEPEMVTRIDVTATATDIASKLTHLMSGNNAFNANILRSNSNQEIVHRADPSVSPASPLSADFSESGKRKYKFTLKSPDRSHFSKE